MRASKPLIILLLMSSPLVGREAGAATAPKEFKTKNNTAFVSTSAAVRDGRINKPLYCVFAPGRRTGAPALLSSFDRRRSEWKFKYLTTTSRPRVAASHADLCSATERPCQPIVSTAGASGALIEGTSIEIPLSVAAPIGCDVATALYLHSNPQHGTIEQAGDRFVYRPRAGFAGADSFEVKGLNSLGQSVIVPFPLTVTARDCSPIVQLSSSGLSAVENSEGTIGFTVSHPEGCETSSTVQISTGPTHGTAFQSGNSVTFNPATNYYGSDSFTLLATNDRQQSTAKTVAVEVAQRNCTPTLRQSGSALSVASGRQLSFPLLLEQPELCARPLSVSVAVGAQHGSSSIAGEALIYSPNGAFTGSDLVILQISNDRGERSGVPIPVHIAPLSNALSFSGDAESLNPYFDRLTSHEVRHLLCKYALCGNPELYQLGLTQGRERLMEALLNYDNSADTQAIRDRVQASIAGQPVDAFARAKAQSVGTTTSCGTGAPFVWTPFSGQTYWLSFATKGDLLRESIALQLHQHIPVNFWVNVNGGLGGGCSSQWTYLSYIDLLRVHALGRPPQTADERPVTGNFKNFITDLLTDYQMALYLTHIQSRFLSGGYWQWQVGVQNNNFARELLQLFTLGQYNVFTGALNYSENDVQEVARALAGNVNEYSANLPSVPALRQTPWRHHGLTEGRWIENLPNHREPGTKLIFESAQAPVRKQGNLTTVDVVDSIVNHSGFAYVPRMFFSRSVYPGVSSGMVQALDQFFRGNNFSVPTLFRKLMSSEATFSLKARYGSIASGTLHLLRLINTLQLPVRNTSAAATDSGASYGLVVNQMRAMGDAPFEAPSVFGYGESGDGDGTPGERNFGRGLLGTQKLLGRFNMPYKLMEFYLEGNYLYRDPLVPQEGFNINSLMPSGVATPSATELLEHFENLFGVTLDAPRRAIALEFIDPQTSGSTRARWNSTLPAVVKARVSGLVAIFANLPEVNVR